MLALVWSARSGDRRLQPFPPVKGLAAPQLPARTRTEAFPALPIGPEPSCGSAPLAG